jgi:hypothetical protein
VKKLEKNNLSKVASKIDGYLGKDNRLGDILFGLQKIYQQGKAGDEKAKEIIEKLSTIGISVDILSDISNKVTEGYDKLDKKTFKAHVNNFPEVFKSEITNFPKQKELQKVEMEQPAWYKQFDLNGLITRLSDLLSKVLQVKITNAKPSEAVPVRLTDGFKFYNAIFSAVSGAISEVGIKDKEENVINPATSDNQTNGNQVTKIKETSPTDPTKLNPSLSITESTDGDVTTTTIVKTIGSTTYTKTVAKNNVTNTLSVSSWS